MDATFSRMSGEFLATFCLTRNGEKVTRFHSLTLHCWSERLGVYADFGRCPPGLATSPVTFIKALAASDSWMSSCTFKMILINHVTSEVRIAPRSSKLLLTAKYKTRQAYQTEGPYIAVSIASRYCSLVSAVLAVDGKLA